MFYTRKNGVPAFNEAIFACKSKEAALLIPVINEGERIINELERAKRANINEIIDIILCDGGSTDSSMQEGRLKEAGVNTLLTKKDEGFQGSQLRMGIWWALNRGYNSILTIDGNNKDSIESVPLFLAKLAAGYDFVQGSRFVKGGVALRTPFVRLLALRCLHAPLISLRARFHYTDTTNAFRAYKRCVLCDNKVAPLRDIFTGYELLAYLSVRIGELGYKICEVPVRREYPIGQKVPTKISNIKGNLNLLKVLFLALIGAYNPHL